MSDKPPLSQPTAIDLAVWVKKAKSDPQKYRVRQVTEILLTAVGLTDSLKNQLYLKGGILMAVAYESQRMTGDIDFSWLEPPKLNLGEDIRKKLDGALKRATALLGYPDFVCKVQSVREEPRPWNKGTFSFPALSLTIGFAERGSRQEKLLEEGKAARTISMDISFNEPIETAQELVLGESGVSVQAYALCDLIAEKFRALLQQTERNRARRQDIYDLALLLERFSSDAEEQQEILDVLRTKAESRDITPEASSLANPEIMKLAKSQWHTMQLELEEELPPFDECYAKVLAFYEGLPW